MASHASYEEQTAAVWKGLGLLAFVTLVEVGLSLLKATDWAKDIQWVFVAAAVLIIALSIYKAYFIIYEFMHMAYEVKGLAMTVLLPVFLLVWAVIAFFYEGGAWKENREKVQELNNRTELVTPSDPVGMNEDYAPFE
ncbi:cytochrome C oxidase subunit IV family protein [Lewinella sp. 4G2]|uniref:cytochrome C oxidase subunit IV family protein n=1 Tax=Lewinella sp. 4G2 TaxID=1803372 RepID=UPI0009ED67A9|nr:cytochrome C oxidase subunit IV family protein [Lewinella sp. 4G2]